MLSKQSLLAGICLVAGTFPAASQGAVLYSNVDPGTADLATLQTSGLRANTTGTNNSYIGAFDDSGSTDTGPKGAPSHGIFFKPTTASNLVEAQVPLSIGSTMGELRVELYQVPAVSSDVSTFTLLDTATTAGLAGGTQWVKFDFSDGGTSLLDTTKTYLLFLTVTHTGTNRYVSQQHYWLGPSGGTVNGTLFRDYDSYALGSTVPVNDLRNPSLVTTRFIPGLYLADVSSVPEPGIGGLLMAGGLAVAQVRRRRA